MSRIARIALGLLVVLGLPLAAQAGKEGAVTLSGNIACAKCMLKQADAKECQNVLLVAGEKGGKPAQYYLVKNEVAERFGHACGGEKPGTVTGTVAETNGKKWLTATKIEPAKS